MHCLAVGLFNASGVCLMGGMSSCRIGHSQMCLNIHEYRCATWKHVSLELYYTYCNPLSRSKNMYEKVIIHSPPEMTPGEMTRNLQIKPFLRHAVCPYWQHQLCAHRTSSESAQASHAVTFCRHVEARVQFGTCRTI